MLLAGTDTPILTLEWAMTNLFTIRKIAFVVGSKRFFSSVFDPTLT